MCSKQELPRALKIRSIFYYVLFFDEEVDDGSISVFEKMDALQNATILEVQIHIDDLKDKLEEVKFTLKISGLYLKKIILWILIINLIRYRLYITKTIY